ncbi:MAG: WhiB family transcriptional regulator [Candidatus Saccharibacteria bacterium]
MTENYRSEELVLSEEANAIRNQALSIVASAIYEVIQAEIAESKKVIDAETAALLESQRLEAVSKRKELYRTGNHSYSEEDAWKLGAECFQMDTDIFFPVDLKRNAVPAKLICSRCEVSKECADYGKVLSNGFGIWGGLNMALPRSRARNRAD